MEPHILPQSHIYEMQDNRSEIEDDQEMIDLIGAQDSHSDLDPNENLVNDVLINANLVVINLKNDDGDVQSFHDNQEQM